MIPNFNSEGNLPAGIYIATIQEIESRYGYTIHRLELIAGLKKGIIDIKTAGCSVIYLDGSFITSKPRPNDYDVCYFPTFNITQLMRLHPVFFDFSNRRKAQKDKYCGEFWPTTSFLDGVHSIFDGFQLDKYSLSKKGILEIHI